MIEKMNLEQFQMFKDQLAKLIQEVDNNYEAHKDDENYDSKEFEEMVYGHYLEIQNQLLEYDLSDIPFEAWEGITILSDETHPVDFSKTKANIDFSLIEYWGNGNFKGCNVRNIDKLKRYIDADSFDEETIKANPSLFLSNIFSDDFKEKYYRGILSISDLANLSKEQLDEIKQKDYQNHMDYKETTSELFHTIGIDKSIQLYNHSTDEYEAVNKILNRYSILHGYSYSGIEQQSVEEFLEQLKNIDIKDIKQYCFDFARKQLLSNSRWIEQKEYPELFIRENQDIFLVNANIPEEVKERFFNRGLKIQDLIDYPDVFNNIDIDYFMDYGTYINEIIRDYFGPGKFQELVQKHPDVFEHLSKNNDLYTFSKLITEGKDVDSTFTRAVKEYFLEYGMPDNFKSIDDGQITYNVPDWIESMNFKFVDKLTTKEELFDYDESTFILDKKQRTVLDILNIENIKRFEQETGFFTHKRNEWSPDIEMFEALSSFLSTTNFDKLKKSGIDFKNGNLMYEEFLNQFARCLDIMRSNNVFTDYPDYDFIKGKFRDDHPEIFISEDAPEELKNAFYNNRIYPKFLFQHEEYIPYLLDKNLSNTIVLNMKLAIPGLQDEEGHIMPNNTNFLDEYISRYGKEKLLQLCTKYGPILFDLTIPSLHGEIDNEQLIEKSIRNTIYNSIIKNDNYYSYLSNVPEMIVEHPDIFVNFDNLSNISEEEKQRVTKAFYDGLLSFSDIKKYPELVDILKDKNLFMAFRKKDGKHLNGRITLDINSTRRIDNVYSDLELLQVFGNEQFLQLCSKYGSYMDGIVNHLNKELTIKDGKYVDQNQKELSIEEVSKRIESIITRECILGNLAYFPESAPQFLIKNNPELFLDEDAPEELKQYFYNYTNNYPMSFKVLQKHREWLPYLKGKAIATSLLRNKINKKEMIQYLELFGEEKGIKLGINRAETVSEMMRSHQVELMKNWYDKTGGKFIPDFVVMQNFSLEEADKFLASGSNWSNLMRIQEFARTPESRDAMLKLAYSFGAFDQDQRGYKKLLDLLTSIPRKIDSDNSYIIKQIEDQIDLHSQRGLFFLNTVYRDEEGKYRVKSPDMSSEEKENAYNRMIEYTKKHQFIDLLDTNIMVDLFDALKTEKVDIDYSKPIFSQLYRENSDGSYSLTINPQSNPKTTKVVRSILERFRQLPILTPDKAHQLFGGFELKYDPDFRDFLLANMDKIMENPEYISFISSIQRQFSDIKAVNSNRTLTLDLAISYVQTNKYTSVEVGNEKVAEISAIAGYSQADFNTLQLIYNYGKLRTFSSIPRIKNSTEKSSGKYTYEILRLDDPLAMAIGTLTDCCQELNNCAEVCMEHSMVDKNGRVFVIRDEQGNIVAQSWVWRNKDVLCFDNIEIPDKAFARASKENSEIGRKGFTDEIFEIYKQAAHDLIEEDEKVYKELLEKGQITQEQYDGLRLGKITVGLGYNDIAESLQQNATIDKGTLSRPLSFEAPVKLSRGLYTSDSTTQYILEEREDRKSYDGDTLSVHKDDYIEYTDDNFTEKSLLFLEKLEIITKEDPRYLDTSISEYADREHLVTELARNYELNPKTTKIVMNSNFAIIFDVNGDKVKIGDLLFNTKTNNKSQQIDIEKQVITQMKLALDQISIAKEVDISDLNDKQKEMYLKATGLTEEEIDIERGVVHAK